MGKKRGKVKGKGRMEREKARAAGLCERRSGSLRESGVGGTFSAPRSQAASEDAASSAADRGDWPSARIYICS